MTAASGTPPGTIHRSARHFEPARCKSVAVSTYGPSCPICHTPMHVVGRRDGIPFLDCADRHHSNADPKIWDDAHMAALLADIREILREMGTNDR